MISFPLLRFTKITETYGIYIFPLKRAQEMTQILLSKMIKILKRVFQTVAAFAFYQN